MTSNGTYPLEGGCDCGLIRYRMETAPLIVHCCHCRWCQRETGTAFALNAVIEAERVVHLQSEPEIIDTPSESGRGQRIARCPTCRVALWSNYSGAGPILRFVRVGTLDTPDALSPDIHIYTASKQPWVALPPGVPAVPEFYEIARYWPAESLTRRAALMPRLKAYRAAHAG
ncbi:MAG TPA: GFA family protein [Steroidobacteraceae bacterium]|nr:GFA family protein [Steroidobacteraceae bacterium]